MYCMGVVVALYKYTWLKATSLMTTMPAIPAPYVELCTYLHTSEVQTLQAPRTLSMISCSVCVCMCVRACVRACVCLCMSVCMHNCLCSSHHSWHEVWVVTSLHKTPPLHTYPHTVLSVLARECYLSSKCCLLVTLHLVQLVAKWVLRLVSQGTTHLWTLPSLSLVIQTIKRLPKHIEVMC